VGILLLRFSVWCDYRDAAGRLYGWNLGTEITFRDNIAIVGYRQLLFAAMAGGAFSFGAIAFVASVAVAGASVGGVLTGASALITGTIIAYFFSGSVSTGVQFAGVALSLVAFVLIARFHAEHYVCKRRILRIRRRCARR